MTYQIGRYVFLHLSPLAGRGRIALAIRVRGTHRAFGIRGASPSPQPSPREERGEGEELRLLQYQAELELAETEVIFADPLMQFGR
jgi:hypothetical protein